MLNINERAAISDALRRIAHHAPREVVSLPETCPVHPGEQDYDQEWVRRLVQSITPLAVLEAAVLTDSPEIFCEHMRQSTHVLAARGVDRSLLHGTLDRLSQQTEHVLEFAGGAMITAMIAEGHHCIEAAIHTSPVGEFDSFSPRQKRFLQAILTGDRPAALRIIDEAFDEGIALITICTGLLQATLYEIGRLWELHQISVGQEHMATAVAQLAFAHQTFRSGPHPSFRPRGRAVVTGIEREPHQFASQIVAESLEARGWEMRYWGTGLPVGNMLPALKQQKPDLLCISLTLPTSVPTLFRLLQQIRADAELEAMKVLVGGQALQSAPESALAMGADSPVASLQQGLDLTEQWS